MTDGLRASGPSSEQLQYDLPALADFTVVEGSCALTGRILRCEVNDPLSDVVLPLK